MVCALKKFKYKFSRPTVTTLTIGDYRFFSLNDNDNDIYDI